MGINLGTLSAFVQNLEAGQDRARRNYQQQQIFDQQQKDEAAKRAALTAGVAGIDAPASGGPGRAAMPGGPPAMPPMPSGGAPAPAAPTGATPQPQPSFSASGVTDPRALALISALNAPQGASGAAGGTQSPSAPQGAPAPPVADPRLSGPAQPDATAATAQKYVAAGYPPEAADAYAESQQTFKSIVNDIKSRNPGIDNYTLALAAQQQIETLKGISPLTKATLQAQATTINMQLRAQALQQRMIEAQQRHDYNMRQADTREKVASEMARYHDEIIALGEDRVAASITNNQNTVAGGIKRTAMAQEGANSRAAMMNAARERMQGSRLSTQQQQQVLRAGDVAYAAARKALTGNSEEDATAAAQAAMDRAAARFSSAAPVSRATPSRPAAPRYQAPKNSAPVKVNTPADVRKLPKGTRWISADGTHTGTA